MIKCPYCKSENVLSCGYDDEAMEVWKCSNCQETFARSDLLLDVVSKTHMPLIDWQPTAYSIRDAHECPNCKTEGFFQSYLIPEHNKIRKNGFQDCGYYCGRCGWSNAGARSVGEGELL